jgi:cytochrome c biogenesis protein CcdA
MSVALLGALLGLALVDCLNPSAIVVTLYLLTTKDYVRKVLVYLLGVFCVYFGAGILLMLGLGALLANLGQYANNPIVYAVQGIIGALMLLYGIFAPNKKGEATKPRLPQTQQLGAIFLLGVTISLIEFATALPYLGAIGLMTNAGLSVAQWLPLLLVYNLIFIAPPLILLGLYKMYGTRLEQTFAKWQAKLQSGFRSGWLTMISILGFFLLADTLRYFNFFGLIPASDS